MKNIKCKHCFRDYKSCPNYVSDNDGCRSKKKSKIIESIKALYILYDMDKREEDLK